MWLITETYKELFHSPLHYSYSIQHFHSHTSTLRSYFQRVYLFLFKVHQISEESPLLTWVTSSKSDVHGCFFCLFCWHFQILTFLWLHFNHLICQDEVISTWRVKCSLFFSTRFCFLVIWKEAHNSTPIIPPPPPPTHTRGGLQRTNSPPPSICLDLGSKLLHL